MTDLIQLENNIEPINSYCSLTPTSLEFTREVDKNEWEQVFKSLSLFDKCVHFWIGDCLAYHDQKWGMYDDMMEQTSFSKDTLRHDKRVSEQVESGRRRPDLSFGHHTEVASLEPEIQDGWLDKAENDNLSVKQLRQEIQKEKHVEKRECELPVGKFRVIYADPAWSFNNSGVNIAAEKQYPTMSTEEICALPIQELCEDTSVLFMWAVASQLPEAIRVLNAWGFTECKTCMVWVKNKSSFGGWWIKTRHELLLIGTKPNTPQPAIKLDSVIEAPVGKHSKKPIEVYELIEQMYPGPYVELFARTERQNWTGWGNQL